MRKGDIEKSLKRFLKRKVSYSLALLIAFMITGGISLGAEITAEEIQESKGDLLSRIQTEREEIKRKIAENERLIKEYNSNFVELVRKGDFYSKPLFNSTQVFFSYQHLDSGKMKDVTEKEFKETLVANSSISKVDLKKYNGVIVNNEKHVISIDVGANIKPIQIKLPSIKPEVGVNPPKVSVNLGEIPSAPQINMPELDIDTPTVPTIIPLDQIETSIVGTVGTVGTVAIPTISSIPTVIAKDINIGNPTLPGGFTLNQIAETELPIIAPIDRIAFDSPGGNQLSSQPEWQFSDDKAYFWNTLKSWNTEGNKIFANNALISQPIMESGELDIVMNDYTEIDFGAYAGYEATINNYKATFADGVVDQGNNSGYVGKREIEEVQLTQTVANNTGSEIIRVGGTTYSSLGKDTKIIIDATSRDRYSKFNLRQRTIINFLPYGTATEIDDISTKTEEEKNLANELFEKYRPSSITSTKSQILALSGAIEVNGTGINIVGLQLARKGDNIDTGTIILNDGTIKVNGKLNSVFALPQASSGLSGTKEKMEIISNTGTIEIDGEENTVILISRAATNIPIVSNFHNNGVIKISGRENVGYQAGAEMKNGYIDLEKPITIVDGQRNVGVIINMPPEMNVNENSKIKVEIEDGINNTGLYFSTHNTLGGNKQKIAEAKINIKGGENNLGIWLAARAANKEYNLNGVEINITDGTKNFGVLTREYSEVSSPTLSGKIELNPDGNGINISGGTGNIGLGVVSYGEVAYNGTISITGGDKGYGVYTRQGRGTTIDKIEITGGTGNIAAYSEKNPASGNANDPIINSQKLTVDKIEITEAGAMDSFAAIGDKDAKIVIGKLNATIKNSGNANTGAIYSNAKAEVTVTGEANINVTGKVKSGQNISGFGLLAKAGGKINIVGDDKNIKVEDGASAIASFGIGSNIDAKGATIEYKGNGYAIFSDGVGTIDISGSTLILDGKAVAYKIDRNQATSPITLNNGTKIRVNSDDVIVFNIQNLKPTDNLSTDFLKGSIEIIVGGTIGIIDELNSKASNFKLAAVDGGKIAIGNLDKGGTTSDTNAITNGAYYYDKFLGQRLVATATGSTISAVLNNMQASKYNDQVAGLEMNSSKLATTNAEAGIHLINSTIVADRTESGAGAIGTFINYGQVTIDGTSSIKVEKETTNAANAGAVGVYAVNGSKVTNDGTIEVGGVASIGILGRAYKEDNSGVVGAEYGPGAAGQGSVDIINTAKITLDGNGSIGIYADNNNSTASSTLTKITNTTTGKIEVGNSTDKETAIGIYGKKATISNQGKIAVGSDGVGIYAVEASTVTDIGTLTLATDGIGVMLDETSKITASSITLDATVTSTGQIGIYYNGDSTSTSTISIAIDISDLEEGTAIYAKNKDITSSGTLTIGKKGIGIVADGKNGTNDGTITLHQTNGVNAIGMYTKNSEIVNSISKNINLEGNSQIGMYAEGSISKVQILEILI